ncbi:MAG: DUF1549 domain-containing protein [Verrucomicrobiae bacterium]|nr:DUF1549 domain-containing protein [Verrucomicrobiae bacterium]
MRKIIGYVALGACMMAVSARAAEEGKSIDFSHDIVPILKERCAECHLGDKKKGGFSMNSREALMEGSENGEVLTLGKGAESYLIEVMLTDDVDIQMPPKGDRVPKEEIEKLKQWIDQKVPWEPGFVFGKAGWEPPLKPRVVALPEPIGGREHPIDRLLDHYLASHELEPTGVIDDATFLRRLHLDVVGMLPSPEALAEFLADDATDKREREIDRVLARDVDYAEHWLTFWNDLLRNDYVGTGYIDGGRKQITNWLYRSLVDNRPYDQFVAELIAPTPDSEGFIKGIQWRGAVNASQTREIQFAQNLGQVFLGINMKCASCHDSFIDRWKLQDAYNLAAVFATEPVEIHRCDKATGEMAKAAWIFPELGDVDPAAAQPERLKQLAKLMAHPENGRFTRTLVNRIWHRMMGRGIVHPVDAMHTAPWSEDLLDWLAVDFAEQGYDLRKLIRRIVTSQAYQAPMAPTPDTAAAEAYVYRGPIARRLTAEQFIDAIWNLTGTAPGAPVADVLRMKIEPDLVAGMEVAGQWIWWNREEVPNAGATITLRKVVDLPNAPKRAYAAVTADNEYTLFVNGKKLQEGTNWEAAQIVNLGGILKAGANEILLVAKNGGSGPNLAAAFFDARLVMDTAGNEIRVATDPTWEWTARQPNGKGEFGGKPVTDWQPTKVLQGPWPGKVNPQVKAGLVRAENGGGNMVRASLVKSDLLMRSLGRPNREQVVTVRPEQLSTLQAIDLANGNILAGLLKRGAANVIAREAGKPTETVIGDLFVKALSRQPTAEEISVLSELAGSDLNSQGVEDLLWAVLMLPEFQLVR